MPVKARNYLRFRAKYVGVEIAMGSTGPQRDQTIWLDKKKSVVSWTRLPFDNRFPQLTDNRPRTTDNGQLA